MSGREGPYLIPPRARFFFLSLGEAGKLLPHMLQFTDEHREEGKALQAELADFQEELSRAIEEIWTRPPGLGSKVETNGAQNGTGVGFPVDMNGAEKVQDPLDKIAKPGFVEPTWRVTLWERK